jgi:hypothetical protein
MPRSRQVRNTRLAISARLATRSLLIGHISTDLGVPAALFAEERSAGVKNVVG